MARKQRRVPKDKATGLPKKYLSGAKNRAAKAREIKRTAEAYKAGEFIDIKAVSASRTKQGGTKKKTTKRRNKKVSKRKGGEVQVLLRRASGGLPEGAGCLPVERVAQRADGSLGYGEGQLLHAGWQGAAG